MQIEELIYLKNPYEAFWFSNFWCKHNFLSKRFVTTIYFKFIKCLLTKSHPFLQNERMYLPNVDMSKHIRILNDSQQSQKLLWFKASTWTMARKNPSQHLRCTWKVPERGFKSLNEVISKL